MKESQIQSLFGKKNTANGVFEIKLVKEKRFNFKSKMEDQQIPSLLKAESEDGCYHKLSDMSAGKKPWDCQRIANTPAYIVLVWYKPRKPKMAYYIRIGDISKFIDNNKSITEEEARNICELFVSL